MTLQKADIVKSIAGHDKGVCFFVLQTDESRCLIANGKQGRTAQKPKSKSLKHLRFMARFPCQTADLINQGQPVSDKQLRCDLARYCESLQNQGGK